MVEKSGMVGALISTKLLALGLGSVISTAAVLVGVGAWQSGSFADRTDSQVEQLTNDDLNRTSDEVNRLVSSVGNEVQTGVSNSMSTANSLLKYNGGASLQDRTVKWA